MQPGYGQPGYGAPGGLDDYLRGAPVGFGDAIQLAFKNIFSYQGRASKSAYWWFALLSFSLAIVMVILITVTGSTAIEAVLLLLLIPVWLTGLSLLARRLHDSDKSGWLVLLELVPFGSIALLVLALLDGTPGPNRFG
jgi:uncharacterized membrane protein YhaH (DUF805 family)